MNDAQARLSAETIAGLLTDPSPYLSCNDCFARLDVYVERRIQEPEYDDPAMRGHLTGCSACAEEADTLLALLTLDAG